MTVPITVIPAVAPAVRPVFGVDEGCGKTVIICGEVLEEKLVDGLKELDAEDVMVEACDVMLEAEDVIVEARNGSVEEGNNESDGTTVVKDTFVVLAKVPRSSRSRGSNNQVHLSHDNRTTNRWSH